MNRLNLDAFEAQANQLEIQELENIFGGRGVKLIAPYYRLD